MAMYIIFILINQQITINETNIRLSNVNGQVQQQQKLNNEKRAIADGSISEDYVVSVARDVLKYGYADERVFVDVSGE